VTTTTGGGNATPVTVTTLSALNTQAAGTTARVIYVQGTISGSVDVGSNKTIAGVCGGQIHGHIEVDGSTNVIIRNLTIVGNNCTDSPSDCSGGADAVSVRHSPHHIWFDHCDVSDGSDGNIDITNGADFVTVSWTKFHYTGRTDPANQYGHQFSNLVGGSDSNASEDSGHLNVTWHHNWWADNVKERMPRVRFGKNHIFNNLYTCASDQSALAAGVSCNIRAENNVFVGVKNPLDTGNSDSASILQSIGNVFTNCSGSTAGMGGNAFTPSYSYTLDATSGLQAAVQSGAGPH
jgi:pectate lyase